MTSGGARDVWPGVRSNIVSVFLSDTVRPAASKTATMTVNILANPSADLETIPASPAYNLPHPALRTQAIGTSFATATPSSRWTTSLTIYLSSLKHTINRTTCITAAKNMLNSSVYTTKGQCVYVYYRIVATRKFVRTRCQVPGRTSSLLVRCTSKRCSSDGTPTCTGIQYMYNTRTDCCKYLSHVPWYMGYYYYNEARERSEPFFLVFPRKKKPLYNGSYENSFAKAIWW